MPLTDSQIRAHALGTLRDGRLTVHAVNREIDGTVATARVTVNGARGAYTVAYASDAWALRFPPTEAGWTCTCPYGQRPCSHTYAAELVVHALTPAANAKIRIR